MGGGSLAARVPYGINYVQGWSFFWGGVEKGLCAGSQLQTSLQNSFCEFLYFETSELRSSQRTFFCAERKLFGSWIIGH